MALRPVLIGAVDRAWLAIEQVRMARWHRRLSRRAPLPYDGGPVVLAGLFSMRTGLARGARLLALDLRQRGVLAAEIDVTAALGLGAAEGDGPMSLDGATAVVVHVNPPLFGQAVRALPPGALAGRSLVAVWLWELEQLPPSWARFAALCDEVWCPSVFIAEAVRRSVDVARTQVRVVEYRPALDPMPGRTAALGRAARQRLGVAPGAFVVSYAFSCASNYARKNPEAVIRVFQRAFPDDPDAVLLLRIGAASAYAPALRTLAAAAGGDARVRLIDQDMAPVGIVDLYHATDVYCALHRSEGYGLTVVEAQQCGCAVLASGWGLSESILALPGVQAVGSRLVPVVDLQSNYRDVPDARWAEPDEAEAAGLLRAVREGPAAT